MVSSQRTDWYGILLELFPLKTALACFSIFWVVSPADLRLASPTLILPDRQNDFLVIKAITEWELKE